MDLAFCLFLCIVAWYLRGSYIEGWQTASKSISNDIMKTW